ncbi:MAG: Ycf51 family protein [Thermostichales cyanobacterium BF4_bins_65]
MGFFQWATWGCGILAMLLLLTTVVLWLRQSPWRFAFVGYTAFTLVLTAGCFALTLTPITRPVIAGAAPYTTVYDQGANRAVIAVAPDITPEQLELTLRQAASNLFSSGRFAQGSPVLTIEARTVVHPGVGISEPVTLGKLQQLLGRRQDPDAHVEVFLSAFDHVREIRSHS